MKEVFKKYIAIITICTLLLGQTRQVYAQAITPSVSPTATETTASPTQQPDPSIAVQPSVSPTISQEPSIVPTESTSDLPTFQTASADQSPAPTQALSEPVKENTVTLHESTTLAEVANNEGSTYIVTDDATNSSVVSTEANTNISTAVVPENSTSVSSQSSTSITQTNSANVENNLEQSSTTGNNSAASNNGDTTIKTGNANTSATAITSVNTNVDGVMVSEFNIVEDHTGDIVLSPEAFLVNCVSGCTASNGQTTQEAHDVTQANTATVTNNLNLSADSGNNIASFNDGDATITTGDATVSANALVFANNNISGNVIYGVVNIYGKLTGDIILPEFAATDTHQDIVQTPQTLTQQNDATIVNNVTIDANTGSNETNRNDGNASIETGEVTSDVNILTIANNNITNGVWWLVLINEAGNWVGRLVGSDGTHMAASQGTAFALGSDGQMVADNTVSQTNNATLHNNLTLSANTGNNKANGNNGNSKIVTGDVNIVANVVNFVNNNIVGNGKLVVTVINVFGPWVGNFYDPEHKKETPSQENTSENQPTIPHIAANNTISNGSAESGPTVTSYPSISVSPTPKTTKRTRPYNKTYKAETVIAGVSIAPDADKLLAVAGKDTKKISINFAWLLLLLPIMGLVYLSRKYFLRGTKKM